MVRRIRVWRGPAGHAAAFGAVLAWMAACGGSSKNTSSSTTSSTASTGSGGATATSSTGGGAASSSSGGGGATSSSSTGGTGGSGGGPTGPCTPIGAAKPGDTLWKSTYTLPSAPSTTYAAVIENIAVGSTGNAYIASVLQESQTAGGPVAGAIAAFDASGKLLLNDGKRGRVSTASGSMSAGVSVVGADHYVLNAAFAAGGSPMAVVLTEALTVNDGSSCFDAIEGFRDLAGNTVFNAGLTCGKVPYAPSSFTPSAAVWKVDPTGAYVWGVPLTGVFATVQVAPDTGDTYLTGNVGSSPLDLGCGPIAAGSAFAGMVDATGTCRWSVAAGSSAHLVLAGSTVYLTGAVMGSVDFGCGAINAQVGVYAAALDATKGTCVWSRTLPGGSPSMTVLSTGEPLLVGAFGGTADVGCGALTSLTNSVYVAKLDSTGACVWSQALPVSDPSTLAIAPFPTGDVGVGAVFSSGSFDLGCTSYNLVGTQDMVLGRLDGSTGTCTWSKDFSAPGASIQDPPQLAISPATGYVDVLENVSGSVDFGGGPVTSTRVLLGFDGAGAFRFQKPLGAPPAPFALDACGAPIVAVPSSNAGPDVTVTKLAP